MIEMLHEAAREAAEVTEHCGTNIISRLVPIPGEPGPGEISGAGETKMNGLPERPTAGPPSRGKKNIRGRTQLSN